MTRRDPALARRIAQVVTDFKEATGWKNSEVAEYLNEHGLNTNYENVRLYSKGEMVPKGRLLDDIIAAVEIHPRYIAYQKEIAAAREADEREQLARAAAEERRRRYEAEHEPVVVPAVATRDLEPGEVVRPSDVEPVVVRPAPSPIQFLGSTKPAPLWAHEEVSVAQNAHRPVSNLGDVLKDLNVDEEAPRHAYVAEEDLEYAKRQVVFAGLRVLAESFGLDIEGFILKNS